jgi:fumarate hydratase class I
MPEFVYEDLLPVGADTTEYRLLTTEGVSTVEGPDGTTFLRVEPEAIRLLTETAMHDISHYLRSDHLAQVAKILDDPEASPNDRSSPSTCCATPTIAAGGVLPICQDTGTAIVKGKKGQQVLDRRARRRRGPLPRYLYDATREENLRYSQNAPSPCTTRSTPGTTSPPRSTSMPCTRATRTPTSSSSWPRAAAPPTRPDLFQETKALLNPSSLDESSSRRRSAKLGTAACPPYHLAIVVGGTSAETCGQDRSSSPPRKYYDELPHHRAAGGRAFRDLESEAKRHLEAHPADRDRRPVRRQVLLPRRARRAPPPPRRLTAPSAIGVSCSADRNVKAKIDRGRRLGRAARVRHPGRFLPATTDSELDAAAHLGDGQGRGGEDRPQPADEGDPRRAHQAPGRDPRWPLTGPWSWPATSPTPSSSRAARGRAGAARST